MSAQLVAENEALHALLADACTTLEEIARIPWVGLEAQAMVLDCLERVRNGEPQSARVCPHDPEQRDCWWVKVGHPHGGEGTGCICLIPPEKWTRQP